MPVLSSRYTYEGTETTETSITRVGSPLDPTGSQQSRKIVTTANSQWLRPFKAEPYVAWNGVTDTNVTATVYGVANSDAVPNNDEIWMDVEYLTLSNPPAPLATIFDYKTGAVTITGGGLIATHGDTALNTGAISAAYLISGKYYFEMKNSASVGNAGHVGLLLLGRPTSDMSGVGATFTSVTLSTGQLETYGYGGPSIGVIAPGDVVGFAVDLTNRKVWARKNAGIWNNSATANPVTGVGALFIGPGAYSPVVNFLSSGGAATDQITANFGTTAYANAAPSGFDNWLSTFTSAPLGKIVTTTKANVLATGTSVTSDSSSWNTTAFTFWNQFDAVASLVFSNSNLTVVSSSGSSAGVRAANSQSTGKFYFEYTLSNWTIATTAIGVALSTATLTTTTGTGKATVQNNGIINVNGTSTGFTLGTRASGNIIGIAIDLTAQRIWFRVSPTGSWNAISGTANDPATGAGGADISTIAGSLFPLMFFNGLSEVATANFGGSAFSGAVPSGFTSGWPTVWSPFKLTTTLSSPQPSYAGYIEARVRAAKASTIYYIDPTTELSPTTPTVGATTSYTTSRYAFEGTETTETSITRVNGAIDPLGNRQSRKIIATADAQWLRPFKVEPYAQWNNVTGNDVNVTVCGVTGGALPNNDDIWMDVEYLSLSSQTNPTQFDGVPTINIVVSNGGLTVTHTAVTNLNGVISTSFLTDGKYYFEVTVAQATSGHAAGILLSSGTISDMQSSINCTKVATTGGIIFSNDVNTGKTLGTTVAGDVFGFAIDLTNRLAWIRRNAGNWNGDAAANPITGVGGVIVETGAFSPAVNFSAAGTSSDNMTANFGATAYANAAPSGFGNWISAPAPLGKIVTTTKANVLAAGTTVISDSSSWSGTSSSTWEAASLAGAILSNNNLTVSSVDTGPQGGVKGGLELTKSSGKYYFEIATTKASAIGGTGIGIGTYTSTYSAMGSNATTGVMIMTGAGQIFAGGVNTGMTISSAIIDGNALGLAVDLDNRKMWFRVLPSGNWNGNASYNPVTNVGGATIPAGAMTPFACFAAFDNVWTANFGATAFTGAVPSGFTSGWAPVWQSFKLTTTLSAPQPGAAGYIHVRPRVAKANTFYYIDPQITVRELKANRWVLSSSRAGLPSTMIVEDHTNKTQII